MMTARRIPSQPDAVKPRHAPFILTLLLVLVALLGPTGYTFVRMWETTADDAKVAALERVGVIYLQPLTNLLATLVDAQSAAAKREVVDAGAVRAAVEEVNRVDRTNGDQLLATQRWAPLPNQIESALNKAASGPDALNVYAVPIGLAQTLLGHVGGTSGALRDTDLVANNLIDGALFRVPEVMVNASRIVALARSGTAETLAIAVAQDRITKAATDLGNALQLANDVTASQGGLGQLKLVDNFTAAALALIKASTGPNRSAPGALVEIDAAQARLQKAAFALAAGLLSEFDSLLERRAGTFDQQHQRVLVAASVATVAAVGLLWVCLAVWRRRAAGRAFAQAEAGERSLEPSGPNGHQRTGSPADEGAVLLASRGGPVRHGAVHRGQGAGYQ